MAPSKTVASPAQTTVERVIKADQTLKASKALLTHIKKSAEEKAVTSNKKSLLADPSDKNSAVAETPIWLTLTTKRHISDTSRLQPSKIALPHSLNTNEHSTICLITADPQRAYKNIIASEEFPQELAKRITRIIGITKLKAKFSQYEAQRKLFAEHDIFLGDDRIINRLPKALGKTFYKSTTKRPIPVVLQAKYARDADGKRVKRVKEEGDVNAGTAKDIAAEIEKALSSALVHLTPSTNTAIRVGYASWTPEQVVDNINAVVDSLVEKFVPQKWKNVRSLMLKGPETAALPIYQAEELWIADKDIVADETEEQKAAKETVKETAKANKKKRKAPVAEKEREKVEKKEPAAKKAKALPAAQTEDKTLNKQIADRKAKLKKAKAKASMVMA